METQVATESKAQEFRQASEAIYDHHKLYQAVVTFGALGGLYVSAMLDVNIQLHK